MLTIDDLIERFDGSLAYSTNSKEICQYIADLLKELKEHRKTPEIVHCGECIYWHNDGCLHPVFGCHDANYDEFCSAGKRKEMKCDD